MTDLIIALLMLFGARVDAYPDGGRMVFLETPSVFVTIWQERSGPGSNLVVQVDLP